MEGLYRAMLFSTAVLLSFSTEPVFNRTNNFIYKKKEDLEPSHHLYLARAKCLTPIHCAVACMSTPGCVLADIDSGDLYKRVQAHKLKTPKIRNYVECQESKLDENKPISKHNESCIMVQDDDKPATVFIMSMETKSLKKAGIFLKNRVLSLAYEKKTNMLYWSEEHAIFKQKFHNIRKTRVRKRYRANNLNIKKNKLVYSISTLLLKQKVNFIYTQDLLKKHDLNRKWHSTRIVVKDEICSVVFDGDIACWLSCAKQSLDCADESTKKIIYSKPSIGTCMKIGSMALVKASDYSMLIYTWRENHTKYLIKMITITTGGPNVTFRTPKTIGYAEKETQLKIFPGLVVQSVLNGNKVYFRDISKDGRLGRELYSMSFPSKPNTTILVEFL